MFSILPFPICLRKWGARVLARGKPAETVPVRPWDAIFIIVPLAAPPPLLILFCRASRWRHVAAAPRWPLCDRRVDGAELSTRDQCFGKVKSGERALALVVTAFPIGRHQ